MRADVAATEDAYRAARDQADRAAIAVARGIDDDADPVECATAIAIFRALITKASERSEAAANRVDQVTSQVPDRSIHRDGESHEAADDHRALATMRSWLAQLDRDDSADAGPARTVESAYATAQANVDVGDSTITRLGVLERLSTEPDPVRRKALFTALAPVWRTVDGDGTPSDSPYQREILPASVRRWRAGRSPLDANARALGLDPVAVEPSLRSILEAWRSTADQAIEPWDQWYAAGAGESRAERGHSALVDPTDKRRLPCRSRRRSGRSQRRIRRFPASRQIARSSRLHRFRRPSGDGQGRLADTRESLGHGHLHHRWPGRTHRIDA